MYRDFKGHKHFGHLHDPRSFKQAVEDELAGRTQQVYHKYLARGCYTDQLNTYMKLFPNEQLMVFPYPEFKAEPQRVVASILEHMKLPELPAGTGELKSVQLNKRPYNKKLDPGLSMALYEHFKPERENLNNLLGHPFNILEP